jgi:hypothetical protein
MIVAAVGWAAAVALLLGYRLVTIGRVSGESVTYLVLNLFGSIGLGISTAVAHAWPSAAVNVVWLGLGIGPLVRAGQARGREPVRGRASAAARCPRGRSGARRTRALP